MSVDADSKSIDLEETAKADTDLWLDYYSDEDDDYACEEEEEEESSFSEASFSEVNCESSLEAAFTESECLFLKREDSDYVDNEEDDAEEEEEEDDHEEDEEW